MPNPTVDRRSFVNYWTDALLAAIGILLAIPAIAYVCAPFWRRGQGGKESFVDVGAVDALPVGKWQLLPLEVVQVDGWESSRQQHAVWVRRNETSDPEPVLVLSPICPHLGCPINWFSGKGEFLCPCHGGRFNADGKHVAGPPPRSMDPLSFEIREGRLLVRWQDFKIGVTQRIPVQS
jgi:menaquinol-cytochrome c reductase iron-sulfur subunit